MDLVIETHGLSKTYRAGQSAPPVVALRALDLSVPRNSIFGFVGPNGAGKTTTLKLLLGLARPTSGAAALLGLDSVRDSLLIRQRIGYLPQNPQFYDHLTAREILRFRARFFFKGPARGIEDRVTAMLKLAGLEDRADRPVRGFSGGERQRLGLAQAQINAPELLILDEPAASLDPLGRRDVLAVMRRLREHATLFYSTHILADVQQVSDWVAILRRGELAAQAPLADLLQDGQGSLYTLALQGDARAAQARVAAQPWVADLSVQAEGGQTRWQVRVTDDDQARARLLRLALEDPAVTVTEFSRRQAGLEDVFMDLVENGGHGG